MANISNISNIFEDNELSVIQKVHAFFPIEIQDIILGIHYKGLYNSVMNELKRENKNAFDTCSKKFLNLIKGTGTFQQGHFDLNGKKYELCVVRRGHIVSPLDMRVSVVSKNIKNKMGNENLTFIEQMKEQNEWIFDCRTLYRFEPEVFQQVMNMV